MTEITFRSDMTAELIESMASDKSVVRAAKVSTKGADAPDAEVTPGFIDFLMKNRHGSPFEHAVITFFVQAPIFVWREVMRHRIASYNEESGRYKQLDPVFYIPDLDRNLVQEGKAGHYTFVPGTQHQQQSTEDAHRMVCGFSYRAYEELLGLGIAREVARMTLPLNIYSSAYVTMNARALMNFLSLRVKSDGSFFPSFPQREIEMVAEQMEAIFAELMPITHESFVKNGRVAP